MIPRERLVVARRCLRELGRALLDAIAEPRCHGCGAVSEDALCPPCTRLLARRAPPWCPRCGSPQADGQRCREDHTRVRHLALVRAPFGYAGTGGALVRRLKFARDRGAGALLARAMADTVRGWAGGPGRRAVVVAVPLHASKRRRRGLDQAELLARTMAAALALEQVPGAMRRVRVTLPQGDPRVTSRERNVAGAFAVRRPGALEERTCVLVDDVTTSGATLRECARVLRTAGVREVVGVTACCARR